MRELLGAAHLDEGGVAGRLFGDLAQRSKKLAEELAEAGVVLTAERSERRPAVSQQVEACFAALKQARLRSGRDAGEDARGVGHQGRGEGGGLHLRLVRQPAALGRPQGRVKELWA